jgi:diaminohydroxyphosphoribosylaminopyrimidine deaminase/5-amino-6-(5-phosphoribosylamino)uracil reductase
LSEPLPARDAFWMAEALKLAEQGRTTTTPNPNVGCVIVKDDQLIGAGYHQRAGGPHAEVHALQQAGLAAAGATAYVTLEPCSHQGKTPPCADALIAAGVARVVCALIDPNPQVAGKGLAALRVAGIATEHGVLASAAEQLNLGFLKRMRTGRPRVIVKLAASLDGATAMASGESQWITGPEARADVQHWRAQSCAILTGVDTVLADDPALTVRLPNCSRQPLRLVLDSHGRIPLDAQLLRVPGATVVLHGEHLAAERIVALQQAGYRTVGLPLVDNRIDLNALLDWAGHEQLNQLWVEAGATLAGTLIGSGNVDEVILYQAPLFLGAQTRPMLSNQLRSLSDAMRFSVLDSRTIGADVRMRLQPIHD